MSKSWDAICWLIDDIEKQACGEYTKAEIEERLMKIAAYVTAIKKLMEDV